MSLWLSTQISLQLVCRKVKYICYKLFMRINLLLTTPAIPAHPELETLLFVLTEVMSSVVLSDTPCKAKFFLRFSRPVVERSFLPPVDEGFSDDLLKVLGCLVIAEDFLHTFLKHECAMVVFAKESDQDQDCFLHSYFVQYFARRTK